MRKHTAIRLMSLFLALGLPLMLAFPVLAAEGSVGQVENFIRNVIKVLASLSGLIAAGFFVVGGFVYITSTGNPEKMDKAKRTLTMAAIGLAITIGGFVLSNIVTELATNAFGS